MHKYIIQDEKVYIFFFQCLELVEYYNMKEEANEAFNFISTLLIWISYITLCYI